MSLQSLRAGALVALLAPTGAEALTFDFFFTGDDQANGAITTTDDAALEITGTIDIDALPGASFGTGDVTALSLSVQSTGLDPIGFTIPPAPDMFFVAGTLAADGLSASLTDFFVQSGDDLFGCEA